MDDRITALAREYAGAKAEHDDFMAAMPTNETDYIGRSYMIIDGRILAPSNHRIYARLFQRLHEARKALLLAHEEAQP